MTRRLHNIAMLVVAALVFGIVQRASAQPAQSTSVPSASQPQAVSQPVPPQGAVTSQTISQTGLLPLFAVDMNIDPSWVDGDAVPSTSAQFSHNGVNDLMDQAWTTLKPAGFNAIRFPVHLEDSKSPVRLANLCLWANSNGVRLIPVLQGTDAMRNNGAAMTGAVNTFITSLISGLKSGAGSALSSYTQISFYQLERPMNQTGLYPGITAATAQQLLLTISAALRQSETQALQGTGVQGTPISIGASYDFELIRQGAIAGVALDPAAEQRAQDSLKEFLRGFSSPNIDAINVEWFPRSISSGDVDRFVTLLGLLKQSFPEKQLTLTTGFSSAFNPADQALQFYAAAISNLGSYRAADGVDSKFVGVIVQEAFKGSTADSPVPAGTADPSQWKWSDRAQQLSAMWSRGTASPDLAWWTNKVQDNMGFLAFNQAAGTGSSLTPSPTLQVLQEIASTLSQATQQLQPASSIATGNVSASPVAGAIPGTGLATPATPGYVPGAQPSTQAAGSPFQQMLFTLLQQFSQQIAVKLMTKMDGSNGQTRYVDRSSPGMAPATNAAVPSAFIPPSATGTSPGMSSIANTIWIAPSDISVSTTSPATGQSVVVTAQVHNQSSDQDISGLTVELINPVTPSASNPPIQSGVTVPRSGVTPVQLTWTPDASSTGDIQLVLQALDSSGQSVTTVAIPKMTVQGTNASMNSGGSVSGSTGGGTASPTAAGGFPTSGTANNSTTSTNSTSGSTPASEPMSQLTVTGFALADARSSSAGQIPQLLAQISNPSQLPTQPGQAQLFMDGTPQQMQTIGSILPSGTLILQFPAIQAATGQHNLQLVVTTVDGGNASSTLSANVTAATTTTSGTSATSQPTQSTFRPAPPRALRPAVPMTFRIGNVVQATPSSASGGTAKNPPTTVSAAPQTTNVQPQSSAPPAATRTATLVSTPQHGVVRTITPNPQRAMTSGNGNQSAPISRTTAVRTIVPVTSGSASSTVPAPQSPLPGLTDSSPVGTRTIASGAVRTITPSTAFAPPPQGPATPSTPIRTNAPNTTTAVRTIVPTTPSKSTTVTSSPSTQMAVLAPATIAPGVVAGLDLGVSSQDVHLFPASPRAGQTATFTAAIKNSGAVAAQGARVLFVLIGNGQRLASSQALIFNIPPHGMIQAQWSSVIPAATGLQIMVSAAASGDLNPANNQVVVPFAVVVSPAKVAPKPH